MAATDVQQWTLNAIDDKLVALGSDVHSLKGDLAGLEHRLVKRMDERSDALETVVVEIRDRLDGSQP